MTMEERAEKAVFLKNRGGYNCCQAVTAVLADRTGLSEEALKAVSAGFGSGMGTMEATCGALLGAGIAAGLESGGRSSVSCTRQMLRAFKERCGAVTCRELKTMTDGKPLCPCEECVRSAVLVFGEVMGE